MSPGCHRVPSAPHDEITVEVPVEYVKTAEDTSMKALRISQEELTPVGAPTKVEPAPAASRPKRPLLPSYSSPWPVSKVLVPPSAPRRPGERPHGDARAKSWPATVAETGIVPATPSEKASASPMPTFTPSSSPYPSSASSMSGVDRLEVLAVMDEQIPVSRNQLVGTPIGFSKEHPGELTLATSTDLSSGRVALSNMKLYDGALMIHGEQKTRDDASGWEFPEGDRGFDKSASVSTNTSDSHTPSLKVTPESSPKGQKMGSASPKKELVESEDDESSENRKPLDIAMPKRTAVRRPSPGILKNRRSSPTQTKRRSKSIRRSTPRSALGAIGHFLASFLGFLVKFAAYILIAWLVINVHVCLTTRATPALRQTRTIWRLLADYVHPTCPSEETIRAYESRCFKESLLQIKNSLASLKWTCKGRSDGTA